VVVCQHFTSTLIVRIHSLNASMGTVYSMLAQVRASFKLSGKCRAFFQFADLKIYSILGKFRNSVEHFFELSS
jgi:hypothetical protein